jgi:NTE family protein
MACRVLMRGTSAAVAALLLCGCETLETMYMPTETVPLKTEAALVSDTRCGAPVPRDAPAYYLENLRDCTAPDTLVMFAFSGGGIRSASFGYGALQAAHAMKMPDGRFLDRDIDVVSGVSGGSFTAAAFANQREKLFAGPGQPDRYRDNFLTHDFFADLVKLYLSPLHWRWVFPYYGTNDEMAEIYADIDFSAPGDKLFAANFGDLAKKGRPLLVVQATDYGNEQPFTFTQNDFDLICSDLDRYPVGRAIAASSAFPILFSPIQLINHHFTSAAATDDDFCHRHRPAWVDRVLAEDEPADLSRLYARAKAADHYLPPTDGQAKPRSGNPLSASAQYVYLQDGGASDNVALRGMTNILIQKFTPTDDGKPWTNEDACRIGLDALRKILIVAVDGEAQPDNTVASLPYLSDLSLILNVTSSTMIDANGFETMLATDAMAKKLAERLSRLSCGEGAAPVKKTVKSYFARVSFQDLDDAATFADPAVCGKGAGESCTVEDLAHSATSLNFKRAKVDALISAGRSAFLCNRKVAEFLADSGAAAEVSASLACAPGKPKQPSP